ncbi:SRPBCC family protein [Streptomyces sp. TRM 70361]|uniref:SRPBCC family protein n=1 Tax=Streptomyces sp. TRM 70361 TaxID=3116553 RepID=UPI002E7B2AC0|nr:SRPBCC family protein [Streptomyces sp. TRM 70361]MEE1938418.1 SRPBCC family protein [Streptomyces sp. TRM 70361]
MTPAPTGRLVPTPAGHDLILTRTYPAPADDVWANVTEPEHTARWFGPWRGEAGPGRTVEVRMAFEEEAPWSPLRIDACEPPHRLAVAMEDEAGSWHLELLLAETGDGTTELRLVHHLTSTDGLGETGPGWEWYLDMLTAARTGGPKPDFDDYYPAHKAYFDSLA